MVIELQHAIVRELLGELFGKIRLLAIEWHVFHARPSGEKMGKNESESRFW